MYMYIYVMWTKKIESYFIAIDSLFQRLLVGLLVEFIDWLYYCFLQKRFPQPVNQVFSYTMCTLLYLSRLMTQLPAQTHLHKDNKQNHCRLGKNVNMKLRFRRGLP